MKLKTNLLVLPLLLLLPSCHKCPPEQGWYPPPFNFTQTTKDWFIEADRKLPAPDSVRLDFDAFSKREKTIEANRVAID